ncbi:hypothetical protein [Paenibacillus gorillae]|uniref:hypothetical protein n=1 Tax=Paenibacillus gorillae TaxID=1243662 RepID=UPI0004AFB6EB|nr:hypothetical protein [Paenibacillus gorillae]
MHSFLRTKINNKFYLLLAIVLVLSLVMPIATQTGYAAGTDISKPVYINSSSYVKLESADLIPSSKGSTASFTVTFYNGGSAAMNLQDYWARLSSWSGNKYTLSLIESDKAKKSVAPKSSVTLTFYSEVPNNVTLANLVLKIIKFDFSVSGYEKNVAKFMFPASYTNDVKIGGYKAVKLNNTVINMRINKSTISSGSANNVINLELAMRNTGKFSVTIPNFKFFMQSTSGALYELKQSSSAAPTEISLRPAILETVKLSVELPNTIKTTGMKLIVVQSVGEGAASINVPAAKFNVGLKAPTVNVATNKYEYITGDYVYDISIDSLQKYPWQTNDNLIGKLTITNKGTKAAPLPKINGAFYLDDSAELDTKVLPLTTQVSIPAKGSAVIYYYGAVSSSFNVNNIKFKLYELDGEKKNELASLTTKAATTPKSIAIGSNYSIEDNGEKVAAAVTDVRTFEGEFSKVFAIYMDITNNQTRAKATSKWTGYVQTANGSLFETKLIKTTNPVNPNRKEQVIVTVDVPKDMDMTGATLLFGLAFNDKGIIQNNDDQAQGYFNPAKFSLPIEKQVTKDFSNIKVGPFAVNIKSLSTWVTNTTLNMNIVTEVQRNYSYDGFSSRKLIVTIEDESTNTTIMSAPIELDSNSTTAKYIWKTGNNFTEINEEIKNYSTAISVNIYEELNGLKKKLVSKKIQWSGFTNWADPNVN